jgi:hypothetical protein
VQQALAGSTFTDVMGVPAAVMTIEQVPDIPMFRQNTAAFIHDLPPGNSRWPDHRSMIEPSAGRSCQKVLLATGGGNRRRPGCGRSGTLQELR